MLTHICNPSPWEAESGEAQDRCCSQHEILDKGRAIKNKKKMLFYHMAKTLVSESAHLFLHTTDTTEI